MQSLRKSMGARTELAVVNHDPDPIRYAINAIDHGLAASMLADGRIRVVVPAHAFPVAIGNGGHRVNIAGSLVGRDIAICTTLCTGDSHVYTQWNAATRETELPELPKSVKGQPHTPAHLAYALAAWRGRFIGRDAVGFIAAELSGGISKKQEREKIRLALKGFEERRLIARVNDATQPWGVELEILDRQALYRYAIGALGEHAAPWFGEIDEASRKFIYWKQEQKDEAYRQVRSERLERKISRLPQR
jgi:hypothetical protein